MLGHEIRPNDQVRWVLRWWHEAIGERARGGHDGASAGTFDGPVAAGT